MIRESSFEPIRFALIGAGGISQSYAQAFEQTDLAQVVAVVDVRAEAARALAERLGCAGAAFTSHIEMLDHVDCDAVLVCTPPSTHAAICLDAIERKVNVLCEKPLALDVESAERMLEAAQTAGVQLTMASKFRHVEDVIRAKSIVESGILGEIILFENSFTSRVEMSNRWHANTAISGGGVLMDNGTHSVDLIRYFLGPIAEVHTVEGRRVQQLPVEDTVQVFVRSESGVMGSIDLSWSLNKELDSFIDIYGSLGTVRVGWRESKYRQVSSPDWVTFGKGYDKVEAFRYVIDSFAKAVRGKEQTLIGPEDALASVEVIAAAYESLRTAHWTAVGERAGGSEAESGK